MTAKEKAQELVDRFIEHSFQPSAIFNTNWICEGYHAFHIARKVADEVDKTLQLLALTDHIVTARKVKFERMFWKDVIKEIDNMEKEARK